MISRRTTISPSTSESNDGAFVRIVIENLRDFRLMHLPTRYHMVHHIAPAACAAHLLRFIGQHDGIACHER